MTSNVRRILVYQGLAYAFFDRAIFTIFLSQQGLSLRKIGLLQAVLWLSTFVAEIPMGFVGDRIGRKPLVLIGRSAIVGYFLILAAGGPEWSLFVAFALFGLGEAAISGSDVSLLYENARREGHVSDFSRIAGRFSGTASASLSAAMLVGGFLQLISWEAVFLSAAALHLLAIAVMSTVTDAHQAREDKPTFRATAAEIRQALRAEPRMLSFVGGAALMGAAYTTLFIYAPVLLADRGADVPTVSTLMTIATAAGALGGFVAWRVVGALGERWFFLGLCGLCFLLTAGMADAPWALLAVLLLLVTFVNDLLDPVISRIVNDRVHDGIRASVLSLYSSLFSLVAVALFPIAGWIGDQVSRPAMVGFLAALIIPAAALLARAPAPSLVDAG
jgi:MFS family permease